MRLRRVLVVGPSMVPTLRHGDQVLVLLGGRVRIGDQVVAEFDSRPGLLVVKRALRPLQGERWWIQGDNAVATDDSRTYGPARILGRVVWRYWPLLRSW